MSNLALVPMDQAAVIAESVGFTRAKVSCHRSTNNAMPRILAVDSADFGCGSRLRLN